MDEDDLDLLEENTGGRIARSKLTRLRRGQASDDEGAGGSSRRRAIYLPRRPRSPRPLPPPSPTTHQLLPPRMLQQSKRGCHNSNHHHHLQLLLQSSKVLYYVLRPGFHSIAFKSILHFAFFIFRSLFCCIAVRCFRRRALIRYLLNPKGLRDATILRGQSRAINSGGQN